MIYFNGFSLEGEEKLFQDYLLNSDYCVAGFSFGAQKAFEYVLTSTQRIDRLILLSPAFFQYHKTSFIRTQFRYFETDKEAYVKQFLENVASPSSFNLKEYLHLGAKEELDELLRYVWDTKNIQKVLDAGVTIEVFVGRKDKIVASDEVLDFFTPLVETYAIKNVGHLLR